MSPTARRLLASLFLAMLVCIGAAQPAAAQIPYINLLFNEPRYAAVVVDANTGEVLYEKHADSPRYPASITKIMTLYLTFEALQAGRLSLTDRLVVSPHAASMAPTKLGVRPGETISVDEAIRAIAVKSANDMAVALAERLGGSESKFAALMTLRAQELGMANTQFVNASGLPDSRQISTARDIAIMSRSVMRDFPQYYSYFGVRQFVYHGEAMSNHNHLLDSMPGVDGLKTGFTNASGFNLSASATRNGRRLIAVVLGGSSTASRDNNVEDLLNTGFEVLRRRDLGETITVAQNLFEPEASGPIVRPTTEQGDGDQHGLHIIVDNGLLSRPPPPVVQPAQFRNAVETCATRKVVKYVKGRHGKRTKVVTTVRSCPGEGLSRASQSTCSKAKKGRHGHSSQACAASHGSRKHHGRATKIAFNGDWQVQIGAFKDRGVAVAQLGRLEERYAEHFDGAPTDVDSKSGGLYRARFTGLSSDQAAKACSALKADGENCVRQRSDG